jgi:hypothetical protein
MSSGDGAIENLTEWHLHENRFCLKSVCRYCTKDEFDRLHESVIRAAFTARMQPIRSAQEYYDNSERLWAAIRALGSHPVEAKASASTSQARSAANPEVEVKR